MIKLEKTQVVGWEPTIRGMRNPMNSWEKSDSTFEDVFDDRENFRTLYSPGVDVGSNDHDLMMRLVNGGSVHAKYRRMIVVYVDITAPLYWWKEFDTYKVGTVANSCSTMHKIQAKEFTPEDFSCEHLFNAQNSEIEQWTLMANGERWNSELLLGMICQSLNYYRLAFLDYSQKIRNAKTEEDTQYFAKKKKEAWWQMIQLLPSSYNQKRTVMLNYEVLAGIYPSRKDHKLDEWHDFCAWIKDLPYSEVIIGEKAEDGE